VIGSRNGAVPELLLSPVQSPHSESVHHEPQLGMVCPVENVSCFSAAMDQILFEQNETSKTFTRQRIAQAAKKRFSAATEIELLLRQSLLANRQRTSRLAVPQAVALYYPASDSSAILEATLFRKSLEQILSRNEDVRTNLFCLDHPT